MTEILSRPFVSMIRVDGVPIPVPPLILPDDRKNIEEWRKQALAVEERILLRRQQLSFSSQLKSRLQSSKIGAIPARSANFEERPQSRSNTGEQQVVRRALTSAAYNDEKAQMLAGMLEKVALDDSNKDGQESSPHSSKSSVDENGQRVSAASGSINSAAQIPSASSTDLEPYLSHSSTSSDETEGTVRPETLSADAAQEQQPQQNQQVPVSGVTRGSYTIENPSSALLQYQDGTSKESSNSAKPQFGHLGSMVARYLTEQQRAKNLSELQKLESILQENSPSASGPTKDSHEASHEAAVSLENSPTKRVQIEGVTGSPSVAGVKRRRGGETKQSRASASDRLVAVARGYLVRRVMQTQKVQHWIQTVRDCRRLLTPESSPGGMDWRSLADTRFREQVSSQLAAALEEFHTIMFEWPLADRLALIDQDNLQKGATPRPSSGKPLSKSRISPAVISTASRGRSLSASTLQTQQHAHHKQQAAVIASLRNASAADVSKRRRLGAVTPPKIASASTVANQQAKKQQIRPATSSGVSAGSQGSHRSPAVDVASRAVSGGVSPRHLRQGSVPANSRPNTAAPRVPPTQDVRSNGKRNVADNAAPAPKAISSRRSTIGGGTAGH